MPAGSMKFVDFSKPDPGEERIERFLIAAQRAMAEGEFELAAERLIYARDAEPSNVAVLRLLTLAFWHAGKLTRPPPAVHDWARVDGGRPAAHRFAHASTRTSEQSTSPRRPPPEPPTAGPKRHGSMGAAGAAEAAPDGSRGGA